MKTEKDENFEKVFLTYMLYKNKHLENNKDVNVMLANEYFYLTNEKIEDSNSKIKHKTVKDDMVDMGLLQNIMELKEKFGLRLISNLDYAKHNPKDVFYTVVDLSKELDSNNLNKILNIAATNPLFLEVKNAEKITNVNKNLLLKNSLFLTNEVFLIGKKIDGMVEHLKEYAEVIQYKINRSQVKIK